MRLLASDVPVITTERYLGPGPPPRVIVWTDYGWATRQLLDHLWDRGARQPALFSVATDLPAMKSMQDAYHEWCDERGVRPRTC